MKIVYVITYVIAVRCKDNIQYLRHADTLEVIEFRLESDAERWLSYFEKYLDKNCIYEVETILREARDGNN